jgi:nuclear pore complex protein Nup210
MILKSIVFHMNPGTDRIIRCDVIVDRIESINIMHTTRQLYLEDSPERFTVMALDSEGNTFTSINGLPFEWNIIDIENNFNKHQIIDSRNVLRMAKLSDSEYDVSEKIKNLEKIGLNGHQILIEGLKTGLAFLFEP